MVVWTTIILWICLILHIILLGIPYAYWQRRSQGVIKHRRPRLVTVICIALILFSQQQIVRALWADYLPVWFDSMLGVAILQTSLEALLVFTFSLYIAYNITSQQMAIYSRRTSVISSRETASIRIRKMLLSDRFAAIYISSNVILEMVVIFVYSLAIDLSGLNIPISEVDKGHWVIPNLLEIIVSRVMLTVMAFLALSFKLRTIQDAFGSKRMLRRIGAVVLIFVIPVYWVTWENGIGQITLVLACDWTVFNLCILPMMKISQSAIQNQWGCNRDNDISEFVQFIQTEDGFNAFRSYLETEFAVENLLFWKAASDFRLQFGRDNQKNAEILASIYDTYLSNQAPLQVNLPAEITDTFRSIMGGNQQTPIITGVFDEAIREITWLMENDSLIRFLATNPASWREFQVGNAINQVLTETIDNSTMTTPIMMIQPKNNSVSYSVRIHSITKEQ